MANAAVVEHKDETQVEAQGGAPQGGQEVSGSAGYSGWKSSLKADLQGSPLVKNYDDSVDGLNKAFDSYSNLEKLLGQDKVIVPKGPDDKAGWQAFSKAMGVPEKGEGYGLSDAKIPEAMAKHGLTMDKKDFAEVMAAHKVHPTAAKGIWEVYQQRNIEAYNKAMTKQKESVTSAINALKGEWGDAYDTNIELGQTVINKFTSDEEGNNFITAVLSGDPRGIKFLAKIGEQFAENKVPEFQMRKFSMAPVEIEEEIKRMNSDLNGPYMNTTGKFNDREHSAAVERMNHLIASLHRARKA